MLLFKPEHKPMILNDRKTQTRRVWKKCRVKAGSIHQARTELFGKPFAHLRIINVHQERLGDISEIDARREGYDSIKDYMGIWLKINKVWNPNLIVYVVDFSRQIPPEEVITL